MTRNLFQLQVKSNPGKMLHMTYDKRAIVKPTVPLSECTQVYTLPHGHKDVINRGVNDMLKDHDTTIKEKDRMKIVNHITSFL
jgi:molybdopterin converting factor small subunit